MYGLFQVHNKCGYHKLISTASSQVRTVTRRGGYRGVCPPPFDFEEREKAQHRTSIPENSSRWQPPCRIKRRQIRHNLIPAVFHGDVPHILQNPHILTSLAVS
jgi:hypothetical protein